MDGRKENVIVTYAKSPLDFWINLTEKVDVIEAVTNDLANDVFEKLPLTSFKVSKNI